jgi:hypothetical protein
MFGTRGRWRNGEQSVDYLHLRNLSEGGVDMEDLMVMEAIRKSLVDAQREVDDRVHTEWVDFREEEENNNGENVHVNTGQIHENG